MKEYKIVGSFSEDELNKHKEALKKRSITPDTHKHRVLVEDADDLGRYKNKEIFDEKVKSLLEIEKDENAVDTRKSSFQYYIDEYKCGESRVLHFGINNVDKETSKETVTNKEAKEEEKSGSGSALSKKSICSDASLIKKFADNVKLENVEKDLLQTAVLYLVDSGTKTVLVDIFERNFKGDKTKVSECYIPNTNELHTIVLYRADNDNDQEVDKCISIIIIDPSNSAFSSYLNSKNIGLEDNVNVTICCNKTLRIYSPLNQEKYNEKYKNGKNSTGPDDDQYRDCIDIAVKLAFGFNVAGYVMSGDPLENNVIKFITNNPEINNNIFFKSDYNTFRAKQKSDLRLVENFNKKLCIMSDKYKNYKISYKKHQEETIKLANDHYNECVEMSTEYCLSSLKELNTSLSGNISTYGDD